MQALAVRFDRYLDYNESLDLQKRIHAARVCGGMPDTILLLQHTPVVTLGRRGRDEYLSVSRDELARRGIDCHIASRGGDVTCHGPGQWVIYPVIGLSGKAADAHGYLWKLEETAIRTAADFGVGAYRREGMNGAWTEAGKIAAIGFHIKRWVTLHGMSFNATSVPEGFDLIVPCGLEGERVASLASASNSNSIEMDAVGDRLLANFGEVCGREIEPIAVEDLPAQL